MQTTYTIERAYDDQIKQLGWDVWAHEAGMTIPNWCSRWSLLRDAKHAMQLEGLSYVIIK